MEGKRCAWGVLTEITLNAGEKTSLTSGQDCHMCLGYRDNLKKYGIKCDRFEEEGADLPIYIPEEQTDF